MRLLFRAGSTQSDTFQDDMSLPDDAFDADDHDGAVSNEDAPLEDSVESHAENAENAQGQLSWRQFMDIEEDADADSAEGTEPPAAADVPQSGFLEFEDESALDAAPASDLIEDFDDDDAPAKPHPVAPAPAATTDPSIDELEHGLVGSSYQGGRAAQEQRKKR
eukprot:CAMPEP_0174851224 /NCGR_PEP_ID=MMETSP1114-20130205/22392_1 /TAXON_ID=312471 /ORGANISM="Neobodo designis, Strain CCAP 1951/1" /LENGTH=163 /DNA_ID=CAMNT_0016085745 /DNA_START=91 /DNA_END=579 /DNA_ORIENTATION=+